MIAASSRRDHAIALVLFACAVIGTLFGVAVAVMHLNWDPLADVRAYYDAGARLNAGLPLYVQSAGNDDPGFYRYPPLLALMFRPLALLPFQIAAGIWEIFVLISFAATIWWIGPRRRGTWLSLGILAMPVLWCLVIGQAQVPLTLLTALGAPWAIALAANVKLFPALICLWWLGRRDWRRLGQFAVAVAILVAVQLVLAPQASMDFLGVIGLKWVGEVRNFSPYATSPLLWAVLAVIGALATLRLAPTRYGWATAVAFSVLVNPRLLLYLLMGLLAAVSTPGRRWLGSRWPASNADPFNPAEQAMRAEEVPTGGRA